jgi:hypothetical protein
MRVRDGHTQPVENPRNPDEVEMDDEGLGFGFYVKLALGALGVGIAIFVAFLLFSRAWYAWGFFGAFIALAVVLLAFGWIYDRRQRREDF